MDNFLNLDSVLGTVRNRVERVGVELEGAWKTLPPGIAALEHDGSVFAGRRPSAEFQIGELPIGPIAPAGIAKLMAVNYPQKVNQTCGMHVHMSFETLWYYNLLMVPEYQDTMLEYLTRWAKTESSIKSDHCIWARLRGESEFCQKGFWPDIQASTKRKTHNRNGKGHRYTIIHYCGRQMTIECRVLPMMSNTSLAVRAVNRVIEITNACIYVLGKNDKRENLGGKVELPGGAVYEEFIEESL